MSFPRLTLCFLTLIWSSLGLAAETRIALVIGNSEYSSGPLPNPANDAKMIGETLSTLGFEVILRRNADQNTMKRAIQEFGARLEQGGPTAVGLFYYAGHGVQLNGRNYLIPTTAKIDREGDVEIEAVSADWVIEQMRYARNALNIVILDACRNNPFTRSMRSVDHGLATMDAPAGILIAYSTAPGEVAADGSGRDSPYTEELSKAMRNLHEPVEQVFKHVRVGVMAVTSKKQVPWESSSLTGDFYFAPPSVTAPEAPPAAVPAAAPATVTAQRSPAAAQTPKPAASSSFSSLISGFFGGSNQDKEPVAPPAKTVVAQNRPAQELVARVNPDSAGRPAPEGQGPMLSGARAVPLLQSLGVEAADMDTSHNYPQASVRQMIEASPRHVTVGSTPKQIQEALTLCHQYATACQLSWFSDEAVRSATLDPFDMDPLPVSVQAFRQFAESAHYKTEAEKLGYAYANVGGTKPQQVPGGNWRNGINKRQVADDAAVIGVSFSDAVAYCHYKGARLPTENEWEYVARGPERHTFPWGDSVQPAVATPGAPPRVHDGPPEGIGGRYRGLSGNVWQWVDSKVEGHRVLKGGSWMETNPANKRAASRRYEVSARADEDSGFRCAKAARSWPDAELWEGQLK